MRYLVTVESFDRHIEEEVIISIENQILRCFMPYGIEESIETGKQYYAEIEVEVYNDIDLKELQDHKREIENIKKTFAYYIRGKLNLEKNLIESTLEINLDECDLNEYSYCDSKYVEVRVDRFNIEFITKSQAQLKV
ncbi:MAG: hypothetical protein AB6733_20015 [Clostridiaceae bacterium]